MTYKPTPEQIQRACVMLTGSWDPSLYGLPGSGSLTALADTIAELDDMRKLAKDFEATIISLKAERDKARADLREIERIAGCFGKVR